MHVSAIAIPLAGQLLILAGVVLTVVVWGVFALKAPPSRAVPPPGAQLWRLRIKGTYQPDEIRLKAGRPTRLLVRRDETAPCSDRIVFPDFGLSFDLPPFVDVAIDLPPAEPGVYRFCCQMDMLEGRLVVEPAAVEHPVREAVAA